MFKEPVWYVTPQEFADLVVQVMIEQKYFAEDEKCHPEDLAYCLSTVAESIAKGMGHAGRKVWDEEDRKKKEALIMPKDIMKKASHVLPDDQELRPTGYL